MYIQTEISWNEEYIKIIQRLSSGQSKDFARARMMFDFQNAIKFVFE